ncbi:hypothetical protein N7528_006144 [Penicillium herquei]|nr:hypothetical protein N7528_006144 [Penicillium herquei]
MKTKAENKIIPYDWVLSNIHQSSEDPNFGFVETLYQTCSAALVSLWKSHFRFTTHNALKSTLKKDVASIKFWEENFPAGRLDTILAESSGLKIRVLETLVGIGRILLSFFKDYDEDKSSTPNECGPGVNFANQLEVQIEKVALILDAEERSEPSSDDETDDSSSTTERRQNRLGCLHSYINCLIGLTPVVERYICSLESKAEAQNAPIGTTFHLSHRAQPYAMRIRDRFENAPASLVERLAQANLERLIRLRIQEDNAEERDYQDAVTLFKPFSLFHDSGLGTSVSPAASLASHTSFLSVAGEEALGRPRVPPLRQEGGRPFKCNYCHKIISIRSRIEWKMHVFADLESYICTHDDCRAALKTFPTRQVWADHEFKNHFTTMQWRCFSCNITFNTQKLFVEHSAQAHDTILTGHRLTATTLEAQETVLVHEFKGYKCLLCLQDGWKTEKAYATHVGRHLEEISLACLPRDEEDSSDEGINTDKSSTSDGPDNVSSGWRTWNTASNGQRYEVDANSKAPCEELGQPVSKPSLESNLADLEHFEPWQAAYKPGMSLDMDSPETDLPQDAPDALFRGSSLSKEQPTGSELVQPRSYWSVAERNNFGMLLAQFGEDFEGMSRFMTTKTPAMISNYFRRRLAAGEFHLEEAMRDAEARKALERHRQSIKMAGPQQSKPHREPEPVPTEKQEQHHQRVEREQNSVESIEKYERNEIPTTDQPNQSKISSGTQWRGEHHELEPMQTDQENCDGLGQQGEYSHQAYAAQMMRTQFAQMQAVKQQNLQVQQGQEIQQPEEPQQDGQQMVVQQQQQQKLPQQLGKEKSMAATQESEGQTPYIDNHLGARYNQMYHQRLIDLRSDMAGRFMSQYGPPAQYPPAIAQQYGLGLEKSAKAFVQEIMRRESDAIQKQLH